MQRNGQMPNPQAHPNAGALNRPGGNMPPPPGSQTQPGGPQQINHQGLPNGQHPNAAAQGAAHLNTPQTAIRGGIPQAQMQPNMRPTANGQAHGPPDGMQQRVLEAQRANQTKMNGQQYPMAPPNRASPGGMHVPNGVGNQPAMNGMQNVRTPGPQAQNHQSNPNGNAASPHMPPPPTPTGQSQPPQLSSGHVPNIASITHQLQAQYPQASAEKIQEMATERLRHIHLQGQHQQSHQQARQSALSAAAGNHANNVVPNGSPVYHQNQTAFHQNNGNGQHSSFNANSSNAPGNAGNATAQQYAAGMRQRVLAQQSQMQHQNQTPPVPNSGSPRVAQASPAPGMAAPSPNMASTHPVQNMPLNANNRTPTPQMRRMGSGQGVSTSGTPQPVPQLQQTPSGMQRQSPVVQQASPRPVSAGVARQ